MCRIEKTDTTGEFSAIFSLENNFLFAFMLARAAVEKGSNPKGKKWLFGSKFCP